MNNKDNYNILDYTNCSSKKVHIQYTLYVILKHTSAYYNSISIM